MESIKAHLLTLLDEVTQTLELTKRVRANDKREVNKLLKEVISEMKIYTAWSGYDVLIIKSYEVYRSAFDLYQPKLRVECILKTKVK